MIPCRGNVHYDSLVQDVFSAIERLEQAKWSIANSSMCDYHFLEKAKDDCTKGYWFASSKSHRMFHASRIILVLKVIIIGS